MGIKLISVALILFVLFCRCKPPKKVTVSNDHLRKEQYVKSFKVAFISGCINSGTNGNLNKFFKESNDLGLFSEAEFLTLPYFNDADSLGRLFSKKIKLVNYIEAGDRKPYFAGCIYLAMSKEVDSMAIASYEQMIRNSE